MQDFEPSLDPSVADHGNVDGYSNELAQVMRDPANAESIVALRAQLGDALATIIDKVAAILAPDTLDHASMTVGAPGISMAALARTTRYRTQEVKDRRELAEVIVMSALINRENPDWNPQDPVGSCVLNHNNPLLTLLQFSPAK